MSMPRDMVVLDPAQFDKIVELLTPGYELSKLYLAQIRAQQEAAEIERRALDMGGSGAGAVLGSGQSPEPEKK